MSVQPRGLAAYDALLGPVAAHHRGGQPRAVALALLCAGLGAGPDPLRPSVVIAWASSRLGSTRPDVAALLGTPGLARPLVAAARRRVRQTSSATGRQALRQRSARRLVGWSLAPVEGHGGVAEVTAMRALAVVGGQILAALGPEGTGLDSVRADSGSLAVALGCEAQAAKRALRRCEEDGWLRQVGTARRGVARTFRLAQLHGPAVAVADDHSDLIDALTTGDPGHNAAAVLLSAHHPAWGYADGLTGRHWAWLLAQAADVDPAELGLSRRSAADCPRDLARLGLDPGDLTAGLDRIATQPDAGGWSTPVLRRDDAERTRATRAAERAAEVARARAEKLAQVEARRAAAHSERTSTRTGDQPGPDRTTAAGPDRTTRLAAVALPPWFAGPADLDRLRAALARRHAELVDVRDDGRAVVRVAADRVA